MAKKTADNVSIFKFFLKTDKIGRLSLDDVSQSGDKVELYFFRSLTKAQKGKISAGVLTLLEENFIGSYKLDDFKYSSGESVLKIKVEQGGVAGAVPTAIQEAGSAYIMTRVLIKNKKFRTAEEILSDNETKSGIEKIFGSVYKDSVNEWTHSYFEHQKAFFAKFQPPQWDVFEHGGEDLMSFIKRMCETVETDTGQPVGRYETWNPADIWVVKDKQKVKRDIDAAIQKDGTAKLFELNNVLLTMMKDNRLIGLSLKKIEPKEKANFKYINKDTKRMEFAKVEEVKMKDIKFEIKTEVTKDGMSQGGYALFDAYTVNIIRTPTANNSFSNLKFESSIKGSGGRGGAAPVDLVGTLMKSAGISFVNKHQDFPTTAVEFLNDRRDYKKMYNFLAPRVITGSRSYDEFEGRIKEMYRSGDKKKMAVAQSKLMQLEFFYESLNSAKGKKAEFWTDLLYLSLKRNISQFGSRFAPHGKLA